METNSQPRKSKSNLVKTAISVPAIALLVLALGDKIELSAEILVLLVLALLPWISTIIESIELPGGGKVEFRKIVHEVQQQRQQLDAQQEIVNRLVIFSMSHLIFQHLQGIYHSSRSGGEYLFQGDLEAFRRDLRYLRDNGYLHHFHVRELHQGQNLAEVLRLTPVAEFYVDLREKLERVEDQRKTELAARVTARSAETTPR